MSIENGSLDIRFSDKESYLFDKCIEKIYNDKVLIVCGFDNSIRDDICDEIIYRLFVNNCKENDIQIFDITFVEDIDKFYLYSEFQIFYLNDFLGKIHLNVDKFKLFLNRIVDSKNKFLIVNIRDLSKDVIKSIRECEDLNLHKDEIIRLLDGDIIGKSLYFEECYFDFSFMEKFILFSMLFNNIDDVDLWIKTTKEYFSCADSFTILQSFRVLEKNFIYLDEQRKFLFKNLMEEDFLISKLKCEKDIVKDLLNNINSYLNLKQLVNALKEMDIKLVYDNEEYEKFLKKSLYEKFCLNSNKNVVEVIKVCCDLFSIIGIVDNSILEELNTKLIYSTLDIDSAIKYLMLVRERREIIIYNKTFKDKLLSLIYNYASSRECEFYNYGFKYFLFVDEFYHVYDEMDEEEFMDIKKDFDRLIDIILNSANSYFTFEYFNLNKEIEQALGDLKFLIDEFNVECIFFYKVDELFNSIERKIIELFNYATSFVPENNQGFYNLQYFQNEFERNREFLERVFEDINFETISCEISENINNFKA